MSAATVVQVLQDLFYVLSQLFVVAAIILSFKFNCMLYCMFYFTCDRTLAPLAAATKTVAAWTRMLYALRSVTRQLCRAATAATRSQRLTISMRRTITGFIQGSVFV